jgi:hypothetical protein
MPDLKALMRGLGFGSSGSESNNNSIDSSDTDPTPQSVAKGDDPVPNETQQGTATKKPRKKAKRQSDLIVMLEREPDQPRISPAQDFQDDIQYFGIKTMDSTWLINSNREYFCLSAGSLPIAVRHKRIDQSRFSPQAIIEYLQDERSVNPVELFEELRKYITRFIYFTESHHADFVALWVMGTYVFRVFNYFPYIWLNAEKGSGKSLLMHVLSALAFNGDVLVNPTPAVVFRDIDQNGTTLFIDEFERFRKQDKETAAAILSLLNVGFQKSGVVKRVDRGRSGFFEVQQFQAYSPKMLAGINEIDDVLQDRTIRLRLMRKKETEHTERYKETVEIKHTQTVLRDDLYILGLDWASDLSSVYNGKNGGIQGISHLNNRELDIWEPIFLLANLIDEGNDDRCLTNRMVEMSKTSSQERQQDNVSNNETYKVLTVLSVMISELPPLESNDKLITFNAERVLEYFKNTDEYSWIERKNSLTTRLKKVKVRSERIRRKRDRKSVYRIYREEFDDFCERYGVDRPQV